MRALQVVQKPQRRGAEVFAHQLTRVLRDYGHRVRIVYLYPFPGDAALPLAADDRQLGGAERHPAEKLPGFHPRLLADLRREIGHFRPDVVQVNGGRALKYGALARALDRGGDWALVYRNIGEPHRWIRGDLKRWVYRHLVAPRLDGLAAVSATTLAALETFYGEAVEDLPREAIPRGVDLAQFAAGGDRDDCRDELSTPAGAPVVVYLGSLTEEKRVDRLLRAVARLAPEIAGLHLWIVGDGPLLGDLRRRATRLGIAPAVRFTGARDDAPRLLAAADVLALTSDTEGIPGVVLEAGAAGLPVVATRVGGVAEAVEDGVTGLLVTPGDGPALEAALRRLLSEPATARGMGGGARRRVEERFALTAVARRYLDLYARVVERRREAA